MGVTVSDCCFDPQRLAVQTDEGCLACLSKTNLNVQSNNYNIVTVASHSLEKGIP